MISKFIAFVIAEHQKYQISPYLVMAKSFLASPIVTIELIKTGYKWLKSEDNSKDLEIEELKAQIAELKKKGNISNLFDIPKPSQEAPNFSEILSRSAELPNVIKSILSKIIDDSIGASNLKERIDLKSKLMGIIEGFEHVNKLIASEPEAIRDILSRIKVNTLTIVLAEIKNDSVLKEKWEEFKLSQDKTFSVKDLPVGAIYNTVETLKANLVK